MMTTSYPHNPGMHPQGMPHGHPMGGPGPNPGQQMPPGMHPGASGPNGPVSQGGPMMAMQPGLGGPNAHALSHLQPQQAHMFAQQQQGHPGMMNPALMQQRTAQQQAFMQHRHQAMLAQQQGGMGMGGFQNPMQNMQNMNPQQIAQMQQRMNQQPFGVNLPNHLQAMQQQQQQQQQMSNQQQGGPQQAAAIAQAQAAHAQQQHMQQQQQQQQAQAQAIAMQQVHSQQSNPSQNANQGPPTTSQPQQGPLRPPSALSHQGHTSPAPPPTPQQQPPPQQQQPPPQQQTQQSGPQPGQQTPAPAQPPNLPQQPNQQPQNPAQMQQRNPAMAQQAQAQAQAQAVQAQAAQARNMAIMKQQAQATGGQGTLKLMNFVDQIGRFNSSNNNEENKVERWQAFVDKFFADTGSFIHCVYHTASERTKQFEIVYAALPRYFYTLFNTEVTNLQITLDGATEKTSPPELKVTCDRAKFIYTYRNQCQVVYTGKLTAFWSGSDKMEWLQFEGTGHQQFIPRSALEQMFHQPSPNQMNPNQSPRMSKNAKLKQQRAAEPPEPYLPFSKLPTAGVTEFGLPPVLQSYLEIYETMNNMTSLMAHYLEHSEMKPSEALEHWNGMMSSNNPTPMGPQNPGQNQGQQMQQPNMPPGVRPPGPGQPGQHMFMSPAMQNQLLPNGMNGSPGMMHTPSPNSHQMVKQQSTSSHTASVNTSPNMQNKRRRSTAKIDLDDGEMNGAKVKQSPRVGGGKRMKGGN